MNTAIKEGRSHPRLAEVAVALCTYNGERYLQSLLDSLLSQTLLPSELVASDDASADSTMTILEGYAARAPFPVRLSQNLNRLGVAGNFEQAIRGCGAGLIALCDQDDVWVPSKLARLASAMSASLGVVAAFSDAQVVDEWLNPLGYSMWQQAGFTAARQRLVLEDRPWEALFKDPVVTGATLIFKRELLPFILPIPKGWVHDAWIAQIAASQGGLMAVAEPLVLYRQHAVNVIGGRRRSWVEQMARAGQLGRLGLVDRELERYTALRERLRIFPSAPRRDAMLKMAEAKLAHLESRRHLPNGRLLRLPSVLGEVLKGNYGRFAKDWRNVAADLLMP